MFCCGASLGVDRSGRPMAVIPTLGLTRDFSNAGTLLENVPYGWEPWFQLFTFVE